MTPIIQKPDQRTGRNLLILLAISFVSRAVLAACFELGNDEVYYWTYALYPDISHFDHPPMVGWLIRIFTFNLQFQQEFFIRLASVVIGTLNTWIIFRIGKKLKDELTGLYAALLYTASIYGFVITGIFILPDTPQTLFWLLALYNMMDVLPANQPAGPSRRKMIRVGIFLGLGMLSKYTTVFLWIGMVTFILFYNRNWLKKWVFYLSNLVIIGFFSIVLVWNFQNNFVSFTFQGGRGLVSDILLNYNTFTTEIGGEFLYHNPLVFILVLISLGSLFFNRSILKEPKARILLFSGIPIILVFWIISLFRSTLPHWSGPGYITLIPFAALWIREKQSSNFPVVISGSLLLLIVILGISVAQIKTGFITLNKSKKESLSGNIEDYSLEVYGWRQLGASFDSVSRKHEARGEIKLSAPIVSYRWFPAANLEYYVARPTGRFVLATGDLSAIHKYAWINQVHGGFKLNSDAWYITSSREFRDPRELPNVYYQEIMPPDTVPITRKGDTVYSFYVYRMINLQSKPMDPLKNL
jgi:hypothetical protein